MVFQIWYLLETNVQTLCTMRIIGSYTFQPLWVSGSGEYVILLLAFPLQLSVACLSCMPQQEAPRSVPQAINMDPNVRLLVTMDVQ